MTSLFLGKDRVKCGTVGHMVPRARDRSSDVAQAGAPAPPVRQGSQPVLRLQGKIGNRATAQVLARQPATATNMGTIQVDKLPTIKITGGNVGDWAAKKEAVEITSETSSSSGTPASSATRSTGTSRRGASSSGSRPTGRRSPTTPGPDRER